MLKVRSLGIVRNSSPLTELMQNNRYIQLKGRTLIEVNDWVTLAANVNGTLEMEAYGVGVFEEEQSPLLTGRGLIVCPACEGSGLWVLGDAGTAIYLVEGESLTIRSVEFHCRLDRQDFSVVNEMFCYKDLLIVRYEQGLLAISPDVSIKWSVSFGSLRYGEARVINGAIRIEAEHEPLVYRLADGQRLARLP